jgi:exodeoxyribonuclease VII large subunit
MVARAIAASPVPVVTGIGHAPDSTLADRVADLAASTPTAAALALTPVPGKDLLRCVEEAAARAEQTVQSAIAAAEARAQQAMRSVGRLVGREKAPLETARADLGADRPSPCDRAADGGDSELTARRRSPDGMAHVEEAILGTRTDTRLPDGPVAPPIEVSLRRLEQIRGTLERGRLPLEESLRLYEDACAHAAAVRAAVEGARGRTDRLGKTGR